MEESSSLLDSSTGYVDEDPPITQIDSRGGEFAKVDKYFPPSKNSLNYGQVQFLQAVGNGERGLKDKIREEGAPVSCLSSCIRGFTVAASALTPIGWIVLCAASKQVKVGEVGLAKGCDGSVYVLDEGCQCATAMCREVKMYKTTENTIVDNPVNILRILPGFWGIADINGNPVVLEQGRHFINDPLFNVQGSVNMTGEYVRNSTVHIITVPEGKLGLVQELGVGHILEPGRHMINNNDLVHVGIRSAVEEHVSVLAKHRIMIPKGRIGLAWDGADALILNTDQIYYIDNDLFRFEKSVDVLDEVIEHGSVKIITVNEGLLGIAFDDGQLVVMPPGRHTVNKPTFMFSSFLSTGQETLPLRQITSLSSDNVGISFTASLTIQVIDANKAVTNLGRDLSSSTTESSQQFGNNAGNRGKSTQDLPFNTSVFQNNIKDRARLNLSIIIGNNKFTDSFLSTIGLGDDDEDETTEDDQGRPFKSLVHDAFMEKFAVELLDECGVQVLDMSIEDIRIVNKELCKALAQAAVKATELEMTRIDNDVQVTRAATDMNSLQIRTKGEALAKEIKANAESARISTVSKAEADRIRQIDKVMKEASDVTKNREMVLATAKSLGSSKTTLIFSDSQTGNDILNGNMAHIMR